MTTDLQSHLVEAMNHLKAGRLDQAEAFCHEARRLWPNNGIASYFLAVSANQRQDYRRAVEWADASLALDGSNAECLVEKALAHFFLGEADTAHNACTQALVLVPGIARAHDIMCEMQMPGENYTQVLQRFHQWLRPQNYLEIGVRTGTSLALANPPTVAVGIDPVPSMATVARTTTKLFPLPSDDYFANRDPRFDIESSAIELAFIDGLHVYEQALRDFINIERFSDSRTVVLIHDCLPVDRLCATREQKSLVWAGDAWKVMATLLKYRPDLEVFTIAAKPTGLGVVVGLDPYSTVLSDNLDRIVAEFIDQEVPLDQAERRSMLKAVDNRWEDIQARIAARRG